MIWIPNVEGDLINLAKCQKVYVGLYDTSKDIYAVIAERSDKKVDAFDYLFIGTEEQCAAYRESIRRTLALRTQLIEVEKPL